MGVINASALTALQTRINAERSRRGLSDVTFTGGVGSGQAIQATHFNELRNATEGLKRALRSSLGRLATFSLASMTILRFS